MPVFFYFLNHEHTFLSASDNVDLLFLILTIFLLQVYSLDKYLQFIERKESDQDKSHRLHCGDQFVISTKHT